MDDKLYPIKDAPTDRNDILCWNGYCFFIAVANGVRTRCTGYNAPTHFCKLPMVDKNVKPADITIKW
jgi:hypothetical protein